MCDRADVDWVDSPKPNRASYPNCHPATATKFKSRLGKISDSKSWVSIKVMNFLEMLL
jgi:hypothetical protein